MEVPTVISKLQQGPSTCLANSVGEIISVINGTQGILILSINGTITLSPGNYLTAIITAHVTTWDLLTAGTVSTPTEFKFTIKLIGNPMYRLSNSWWKLVLASFSSSNMLQLESANSIHNGVTMFEWSLMAVCTKSL
jgi:hypothetical protein